MYARYHYTVSRWLSPDRCYSLIFIYWYCTHQDLHSFPTRRSSDLGSLAARRCAPAGRRSPSGSRRGRASSAEIQKDRSEEHTSELQSRQYLVCRLLLEKKK